MIRTKRYGGDQPDIAETANLDPKYPSDRTFVERKGDLLTFDLVDGSVTNELVCPQNQIERLVRRECRGGDRFVRFTVHFEQTEHIQNVLITPLGVTLSFRHPDTQIRNAVSAHEGTPERKPYV